MSDFDPRDEIKGSMKKARTIFGVTTKTWVFLAVLAGVVMAGAVVFNVVG